MPSPFDRQGPAVPLLELDRSAPEHSKGMAFGEAPGPKMGGIPCSTMELAAYDRLSRGYDGATT
jgi:hypothetical protein